jgi:tRNA(fMet)-specific endonuclease VapC
MIRFMLDTNICVYVIKEKPPQVIARLRSKEISEVGISSITLSELEYGVAKSSKPGDNKLALMQFLAPLEIVAYDDRAAREYGDARADLERRGVPIGALDTLIAAHARSLKCRLVTNNDAEFSRVPGLPVENWVR